MTVVVRRKEDNEEEATVSGEVTEVRLLDVRTIAAAGVPVGLYTRVMLYSSDSLRKYSYR